MNWLEKKRYLEGICGDLVDVDGRGEGGIGEGNMAFG